MPVPVFTNRPFMLSCVQCITLLHKNYEAAILDVQKSYARASSIDKKLLLEPVSDLSGPGELKGLSTVSAGLPPNSKLPIPRSHRVETSTARQLTYWQSCHSAQTWLQASCNMPWSLFLFIWWPINSIVYILQAKHLRWCGHRLQTFCRRQDQLVWCSASTCMCHILLSFGEVNGIRNAYIHICVNIWYAADWSEFMLAEVDVSWKLDGLGTVIWAW